MKVARLFLWHLATCLRASAALLVDDSSYSPSPDLPPVYDVAADNGSYGYYPTRTYATVENLRSPRTNFLMWNDKCDDGLLYFITPRGWSLPEPGPMILDRHGELIWSKHFGNKYGGQAYDFMVQSYQGEEYLTFWLGDDRVRGHGSGYYYMLNASYDIVHKVGAANGLAADLHEFLITSEGTALMTMYQVVAHDVSALREFDPSKPEDQHPNYIWDCVFQEVDIATGKLVFEWRASDHINVNESFHKIGGGGTKNDPFDWFHINSIQKDDLGNYLISARYTHSITYIDGKTGNIIWTLGGRRNSFMDLSLGFATNFAWQHDARFLPVDTFPNMHSPPTEKPGFTTKLVTLFDNAAEDQHYEYGMIYSRGLLLEVTYPTPGGGKFRQSEEDADLTRRLDSRSSAEHGSDVYSDPALNNRKIHEINATNPDYVVQVVKSYTNPNKIRSSSQGSLQILPQDGGDPKVFVGFGLNALWTEFEADGSVLCDVHFGAKTSWERGDIQSYRAYKFAWRGKPEKRPDVEISDDDVEVYVSWNGATEVVDWILQCSEIDSDDEQDWADVVRLGRQGFETVITMPEDIGDVRYLRVIALGEGGRRLDYGISETIDRGLMSKYFPMFKSGKFHNFASQMSPLKAFLIMVSALLGVLILYECYRRYLSWRVGRPGGGSLRWKSGPAYRLLGEA